MRFIDNLLNRVTMYRLVVYVLSALTAITILFALLGRYHAKLSHMLATLLVILVATYTTDRLFSRLFRVPRNMESWLITGLILFLIVPNSMSLPSLIAVALAAAIASASKFLLARHGKHIFNPAALAAAFLSVWGFWPATWWIGSSMFWPFTLVLGLAVVRKIRRFALVITFLLVSIGLQAILFLHLHQPLGSGMKQALLSSPLFFLATIMLTEPATMPPRRNWQLVFGALVALLYVTGWKIGPLVILPEVALLGGNVLAYLVSPKFRVRLVLKEVQKISDQVYTYIFTPDAPFHFLPGQYMEWTLAGVPYDNRGNRRTFTIASSPTEDTVQLGLKYYEPSSTYKARLMELQPGDVLWGSQLAGDFTLQGHEGRKLAFIAGGIGITPFRSMVKYLTDTNTTCDIVLLYLVNNPKEYAYARTFKQAAKLGVKTIPVISDPAQAVPGILTGSISATLLARTIPDYSERLFYVSGPPKLVETTEATLHSLQIPKLHIKTDHFSGY